jgi:hypothetical protein
LKANSNTDRVELKKGYAFLLLIIENIIYNCERYANERVPSNSVLFRIHAICLGACFICDFLLSLGYVKNADSSWLIKNYVPKPVLGKHALSVKRILSRLSGDIQRKATVNPKNFFGGNMQNVDSNAETVPFNTSTNCKGICHL